MFSYIYKQNFLIFLAGSLLGALVSNMMYPNGQFAESPALTVDVATQTCASLTEYVVVEYV